MSSLLGDLNAVDSSLTSANLNANNNSDRTILKLPLNRVKLDPQNVRHDYDQTHVEDLANSILKDGLLQPISVRPDSDNPGEYIINMGHYRYLAHQHLNLDSIEATIDNKLGSRRVKMSENMFRKDMSLLEIATNLNLMLQEGLAENPKYSYDDLANELKKSKTWVSRRLQLLESDDYLKSLMADKMVNDAETGTIIKNLLNDFPDEVKALVADHEGAISSKLARVWSKELKGEITASSSSEGTQSSLELQNSPNAGEKNEDIKEDNTQEPITETKEPLPQKTKVQDSDENADAVKDEKSFTTTTQKQTKEIVKQANEKAFSELEAAYFNGILESYVSILDLTESEDEDLVSVACGFLRSFNDENTANLFSWKSLIQYPVLVNELATILDSMAQLHVFVPSSKVEDTRMQVILNQQDLI
ncbi:ParB/RepB/Spo0J family partition protein [Acinetobacter pittii]|uniref:ParB/RepB/Spo0J family partition protein n=1 Tax=Acinetobacter pittii TaxID=48296 RepID=UPI003890AFF6